MLSGRNALANIDQALMSARSGLEQLDGSLASVTEERASIQREIANAINRLAEVRLDALSHGQLRQALEAVDHQVLDLLAQRREAHAELQGSIAATTDELENLEKRREEAHAEVDAVSEALAQLEASVQSMLDEDEKYQDLLNAARAAEAIAEAADQKTHLAEADKNEKGAPFNADPLFMYLWKRHYGTSEYHANPLIRTLDGWVARVCNFEPARVNYWTLNEIPKRLAEHAANVRADADAHIEVLRSYEREAAQRAGVPEKQTELEHVEARQAEIDQQIEQKENELRELLERNAAFVSGKDPFMQKSLSLLTNALSHHSLVELAGLAATTSSREDDAVIRELDRLQDRDEELKHEIAEQQRSRNAHFDRLKELEGVRRRFKLARYDDLRSGFVNEHLIVQMINDLLRGGSRGAGGALWDMLRRHQRYRDLGNAWPDFGSGGLGRNRRGAPWHWPGGGGGGFRLPRGGGPRSRGGRGGFRTGGGF